jgi:hypothetical protein
METRDGSLFCLISSIKTLSKALSKKEGYKKLFLKGVSRHAALEKAQEELNERQILLWEKKFKVFCPKDTGTQVTVTVNLNDPSFRVGVRKKRFETLD